jgi:hypothetical protein
MIDPSRRDLLWKEYYRALHNGDKQKAQALLKQIHSPPTTVRNNANTRGRGCSRCRRSL